MNFIAAHKLALMLGLALTGAAIYFLRKRAGSAGVAGAPYDNGVPISPYSDSAAPQFTFDFGSLLGGQPTPPPGSSAPPPNSVGGTTPPPPPGTGGDIHWFGPGGSGIFHPGTPPAVSLPIVQAV